MKLLFFFAPWSQFSDHFTAQSQLFNFQMSYKEKKETAFLHLEEAETKVSERLGEAKTQRKSFSHTKALDLRSPHFVCWLRLPYHLVQFDCNNCLSVVSDWQNCFSVQLRQRHSSKSAIIWVAIHVCFVLKFWSPSHHYKNQVMNEPSIPTTSFWKLPLSPVTKWIRWWRRLRGFLQFQLANHELELLEEDVYVTEGEPQKTWYTKSKFHRFQFFTITWTFTLSQPASPFVF